MDEPFGSVCPEDLCAQIESHAQKPQLGRPRFEEQIPRTWVSFQRSPRQDDPMVSHWESHPVRRTK